MGGGGMRPPNMQAMKPPSLEDLIPPNHWALWHLRLQDARAKLPMTPAEVTAYDALVKELGDIVKLNERQLWRSLGRSRATVSSVTDVPRDVRNACEEAKDFAAGWEDFFKTHATFHAAVGEGLRKAVDEQYEKALVDVLNAPRKFPMGKPAS
jgi:hypothetical protein